MKSGNLNPCGVATAVVVVQCCSLEGEGEAIPFSFLTLLSKRSLLLSNLIQLKKANFRAVFLLVPQRHSSRVKRIISDGARYLKKLSTEIITMSGTNSRLCDILREAMFDPRFLRFEGPFLLMPADAVLLQDDILPEFLTFYEKSVKSSNTLLVRLLCRSDTQSSLSKHSPGRFCIIDPADNHIVKYGSIKKCSHITVEKVLLQDIESSKGSLNLIHNFIDGIIDICCEGFKTYLKNQFDCRSIYPDLIENVTTDKLKLNKVEAFYLRSPYLINCMRIRELEDLLFFFKSCFEDSMVSNKYLRITDIPFRHGVTKSLPETGQCSEESFLNSFIANDSQVGKESRIENSIIFDKVKIGERCTIVNCLILREVNIDSALQLKDCIVSGPTDVIKITANSAIHKITESSIDVDGRVYSIPEGSQFIVQKEPSLACISTELCPVWNNTKKTSFDEEQSEGTTETNSMTPEGFFAMDEETEFKSNTSNIEDERSSDSELSLSSNFEQNSDLISASKKLEKAGECPDVFFNEMYVLILGGILRVEHLTHKILEITALRLSWNRKIRDLLDPCAKAVVTGLSLLHKKARNDAGSEVPPIPEFLEKFFSQEELLELFELIDIDSNREEFTGKLKIYCKARDTIHIHETENDTQEEFDVNIPTGPCRNIFYTDSEYNDLKKILENILP